MEGDGGERTERKEYLRPWLRNLRFNLYEPFFVPNERFDAG